MPGHDGVEDNEAKDALANWAAAAGSQDAVPLDLMVPRSTIDRGCAGPGRKKIADGTRTRDPLLGTTTCQEDAKKMYCFLPVSGTQTSAIAAKSYSQHW